MAKTNLSSTQWKEERRFRAWELDQERWKQRMIAKALGLNNHDIVRTFGGIAVTNHALFPSTETDGF
jgi:hypothetical protein